MGHDTIGVGRGRDGAGATKRERIRIYVVRDQSSIVVHCTSHDQDTKQSKR